MQQLCQQIALGIKYIQHFGQHLERYSAPYNEQIKQYLVYRLQKYKEYTALLNDKIEAKYQVNTQPMDEMLIKLVPQSKVEDIKQEQVRLSKK